MIISFAGMACLIIVNETEDFSFVTFMAILIFGLMNCAIMT